MRTQVQICVLFIVRSRIDNIQSRVPFEALDSLGRNYSQHPGSLSACHQHGTEGISQALTDVKPPLRQTEGAAATCHWLLANCTVTASDHNHIVTATTFRAEIEYDGV